MHIQTSCLSICIATALCRFSRAAWVADSTLPGIPYLSHQRGLQQVSACGSPAWQCSTSSDQRMQLSDSVHATVLAGNCTALSTALGLWQCGATLVQDDVIAAVQQGSCSSSCIDPQQQLCTQPSTPAPAPGDLRSAYPGPGPVGPLCAESSFSMDQAEAVQKPVEGSSLLECLPHASERPRACLRNISITPPCTH